VRATFRKHARNLSLAAGSALAGCCLGLVLLFLPAWSSVEHAAFDRLSVAAAPRASSMPVVIVAIDAATHAHLGTRWPLPHELHALLIDRLVDGGAAVIAFDLSLSASSTPEGDRSLAESIARASNVLLGSRMEFADMAVGRVLRKDAPPVALTEAGAPLGMTDTPLDEDRVPRRFDTRPDAFWRAVMQLVNEVMPGTLELPDLPAGALIRHLGPRETFAYVSYYQVINGDEAIPEDYFADTIVLVGRDEGAHAGTGEAQDLLATPFTRTGAPLTPHVEVLATQLENAMENRTIRPAPRAAAIAWVVATVLLVLPALVAWHPLRSAAVALLVAGLGAGGCYWLLARHDVWMQGAAALAALGCAVIATGAGSFLTERRRAQEIRGAFAKYVSAEIVEEMIAHPERLRLGGERRELTVLIADLEGFTTLAEKLSPDVTAHLVNVYLDAMTEAILAHGGTVDKFMGDAVMAFWNAPLPDPAHALHATQAAQAMCAAMDGLEPAFAAQGLGAPRLRIGLNTGPAIVGNMGSSKRFDYTAIGDTVNLTARLEPANKQYGTTILLSAGTAAALEGAVALRFVDRLTVRGKDQPVEVFTIADPAPA
jgi:adenylate cyclase